MPLSPGTKLGPYEVLSGLGAGGMGEVYRARDTKLDRAADTGKTQRVASGGAPTVVVFALPRQ